MKEMMNAAVLHAVGDLRYEQVPVPEVHEGEVLMTVMAAGVCGTDVHIYHGEEGATEVNPPVVLGHEYAGVYLHA